MKTKLALIAFTLALVGCESGGSNEWSASGSVYYGVGFYDPYFYGNPWYGGGGGAVVVRPPVHRPPPRVGHH
jgi:hypothetical protein